VSLRRVVSSQTQVIWTIRK